MLAQLNDGFITSCQFIVMLPLSQMKTTAVSTPQNEKINHKMFLRVEISFKMVGKVESLPCFCEDEALFKTPRKLR